MLTGAGEASGGSALRESPHAGMNNMISRHAVTADASAGIISFFMILNPCLFFIAIDKKIYDHNCLHRLLYTKTKKIQSPRTIVAGQAQDSKLHSVFDGTRRDDRPRSSAMREIRLFSDGRGRPSLQRLVHFDDKYVFMR